MICQAYPGMSMPGRPISKMVIRPVSNCAATSAVMVKMALMFAEKSDGVSMTISGTGTPEPPTGDTTEIRDVGRYNSSDYNNPNRSLNVNVRVEIDFQARKHSEATILSIGAVNRLFEKCHVIRDTGRAKLDLLGHMQRLLEDLLSGILGRSDVFGDVSLDKFDNILNDIIVAFEIIGSSGFGLFGLVEVVLSSIIDCSNTML